MRIAFVIFLALVTVAPVLANDASVVRIADRVLLVPDRSGSPAQFQMVVNAGSTDEADGVSHGLAHYLEHLFLNGRNSNNGDVAMRFFPGGSSNGWTNQRATVFVHTIPFNKANPAVDLAKLFDFYSRQLKTADYQPQMAARERNVVLQEHDLRYGDNPIAAFSRTLDAKIFAGHAYAYWAIGTRKQIAALTIADAKAFHKRWYHINNVWFVIKGNIKPEDLRQITAKYLSPLKPVKIEPHARLKVPDTSAVQEFLLHKDQKVKQAVVYFRKLVTFGKQAPARDYTTATLLTNIVQTQLPGSLHDAIVEQQPLAMDGPSIAIEPVVGNTYLLKIAARPADAVDPRKLLGAIKQYVEGLRKPGFSDRSIKRIKTRFEVYFKRRVATPRTLYPSLVAWLADGRDFDEFGKLPDLVKDVSRSELEALATALAGPGRSVAGILLPASDVSASKEPASAVPANNKPVKAPADIPVPAKGHQ